MLIRIDYMLSGKSKEYNFTKQFSNIEDARITSECIDKKINATGRYSATGRITQFGM